jgi:hypothetical protein
VPAHCLRTRQEAGIVFLHASAHNKGATACCHAHYVTDIGNVTPTMGFFASGSGAETVIVSSVGRIHRVRAHYSTIYKGQTGTSAKCIPLSTSLLFALLSARAGLVLFSYSYACALILILYTPRTSSTIRRHNARFSIAPIHCSARLFPLFLRTDTSCCIASPGQRPQARYSRSRCGMDGCLRWWFII